ncbi:MAG: hypothetical protein KJ831_00295, partial [Candidatus Eisenbacteria bacterium]|nr:hypothetical protein [Candidatus Eisenbacteria bacterium]
KSPRRIRLNHVFPDSIGVGRIEAEQYKMVVDSLSRPELIFPAQLPNEFSHLRIDLGPPSLLGLPTPVEPEA